MNMFFSRSFFNDTSPCCGAVWCRRADLTSRRCLFLGDCVVGISTSQIRCDLSRGNMVIFHRHRTGDFFSMEHVDDPEKDWFDDIWKHQESHDGSMYGINANIYHQQKPQFCSHFFPDWNRHGNGDFSPVMKPPTLWWYFVGSVAS